MTHTPRAALLRQRDHRQGVGSTTPQVILRGLFSFQRQVGSPRDGDGNSPPPQSPAGWPHSPVSQRPRGQSRPPDIARNWAPVDFWKWVWNST